MYPRRLERAFRLFHRRFIVGSWSINNKIFSFFPCETFTTEMTVAAGTLVDWLSQIQFSGKFREKKHF